MARVLVVDDREPDRQYVSILLEQAGHAVIEAQNGLAAIRSLEAAAPDLIITDLLMPAMDGFEFVRRARALSDARTIPVLFYTSSYDEGAVRSLVDSCSPAALVPKGPDSRPRLLHAVENMLARNSALPSPPLNNQFSDVHLQLLTTMLHAKVAELERTNAELRDSNHALTESNYALRQFAFSAAHELQEPTRNVVNAAGMLKQQFSQILPEAAGTLVEECISNGVRMHAMIKGLLAYITVLEGEQHSADSCDANEALREAVSRVASTPAVEPGQFRADTLPAVAVRQNHLQQVFHELIANALKFRSPDRRLAIEISAEWNQTQWTIHVADNGLGFRPEYSEQIFRLFNRLYRYGQYPGIGVGLALCARIINHYGGRIWATAKAGEGATFSFTVPGLS